jgi:hypothetical protein
VFFEGTSNLTFHDPLAAATLFDTQVCRFEAGTVIEDIETGRTD